MAGPQVFAVDQAATFGAVLALAANPKTALGSDEQQTTKDGGKKWEVQLSAGFRQFGKTNFETIKVGVVADKDPLDGITPGTPVQLVGFQVGVMDKQIRDKETGQSKTVGAQVWYRADEIRSTAATGSTTNGKRATSAEAA